MRVLHITNAFPIPEHPAFGIFIKEQIESLKEIGIDCDVFFINAYQKGKLEYLRVLRKLFILIKNYDLIHCHHPYTFFAAFLANAFRKRIITSFLGSIGNSDNSLFVAFSTIILSDSIIVKRAESIKYLTKKINLIPNGVSLKLFSEIDRADSRRELKLKDNSVKYVLFCSAGGTDRKVKRYDRYCTVISILKSVYKENVDELLLINDNRERIPFYFNAANVHLITSDYEGSPNSVKESLACNIPVVSTDVGNVKTMLEGIEGCYVSKSFDPEELANLIAESFKNDRIKGRLALSEKGLDMNNIALKIQELYNSVVKNN